MNPESHYSQKQGGSGSDPFLLSGRDAVQASYRSTPFTNSVPLDSTGSRSHRDQYVKLVEALQILLHVPYTLVNENILI